MRPTSIMLCLICAAGLLPLPSAAQRAGIPYSDRIDSSSSSAQCASLSRSRHRLGHDAVSTISSFV